VQVSNKLSRLAKRESGIELQTVGGERPQAALLGCQAVQAFRDTTRFCDEYGWICSHVGPK